MNSLNLLSSRVIGQSPLASRPRSKSQADQLRAKLQEELLRGRTSGEEQATQLIDDSHSVIDAADGHAPEEYQAHGNDVEDEKQPLLNEHGPKDSTSYAVGLRYFIKRLTDAITAFLSTIGVPVVYLVKCFQDEDGHYSPMVPFRRSRSKRAGQDSATQKGDQISEKPRSKVLQETKLRHSYSSDSLNSTTSESESEKRKIKRGQRSQENTAEEPKVRRQSARIKLLHNDEATQKRRRRSALSEQIQDGAASALTVDNIKSPTSAAASLRVTRYPHTTNAPRPLVPRRQPSYSNLIPHMPSRSLSSLQQKTLVLDLDETLIHSLAKGGRMSSGHMVEVKLNVPVAVPSSLPGHHQPSMIGPQHPILYYVHKRPHCDDFLRKVCKWYKLVVFTASVQEYADPVIDWLEQERKYFSGRYYRQHCTFRNGSYIKDLSSIEPDLSKVIILDNSPVSYIFHEDNAVPIEGWINDPTDNDLLHLIPMLEALQYVNDVRALLALRRGEAEVA